MKVLLFSRLRLVDDKRGTRPYVDLCFPLFLRQTLSGLELFLDLINLAWNMDSLPLDLSLKIFHLLDHPNLATSLQVCRKWKDLASNNLIWYNLFKERWGQSLASFYAPLHSKTWKDVYEVQDRCDRVGLGLKIIREGCDYYLVHQGEIQRYLGSTNSKRKRVLVQKVEHGSETLDKILFFIGDLETAMGAVKRAKM